MLKTETINCLIEVKENKMEKSQLEKYPVLKMIEYIQNVNEIKKCPESKRFLCFNHLEIIKLDTNIKLKINEEEKKVIESFFSLTSNIITNNYFNFNSEKEYYVENYSVFYPVLATFKNLHHCVIREGKTSPYLKCLNGLPFKLKNNELMPINYKNITENNKPDFLMPLSMVATIIKLNEFYKEEHYCLKIEGNKLVFETNSFEIIQKNTYLCVNGINTTHTIN